MAIRASSVRTLVFFALIAAGTVTAFTEGVERTAQAGTVTGVATPINIDDANSSTIDFKLVLDTHSVPLTFVASTDALLSDGKQVVAASRWTGGLGGHHVSGVLSFPAGALRNARDLVLTLRVGGKAAELTFQWTDLQRLARK